MRPRHSRVDANQSEVVALLNEMPGVVALVIHEPVDILVGYRCRNFLFELKDGNKKDYEHAYTQKQKDFLRDWPGQVRVAKSFDEVLKVITNSYERS